MSLSNIDDKLQGLEREETEVKPIEAVEPNKEENLEDNESERLSYLDQFRKDKEESLSKQSESSTPEEQSSDLNVENENDKEPDQQETDEYGNELPKQKVYTEEEVQAMIRKRLKLHHEEKQQQQQYQPPQQQQSSGDFQHDAESDIPWEVQLENHIKQTVQKIEHEKQQQQWQREVERAQAEFETKFTTGMSKYSDFVNVVADKPITNGIMMAVRNMADPAAFIYAAAKQQPKELERISQIQDPYTLAAEVGRLEERMKKARNVSSAPKPLSKTKGDVAEKGNMKASIDDLIRIHAKSKLGRK